MADAEEAVTDLYGFDLSKATVKEQAQRLQCDGTSARLQAAWLPFLEKNKLPPEVKLKEMVRKGVPPTLRSWVWMETSGAAKKKAAVGQKNYYANMVLAGERSPFLKDIEQDAGLSSHPWLQEAEGRAALRRVLSAYSVHNEGAGYCRLMASIVGLLLVALNRNEESAFWLLAALVEDTLYPGTYSANLVGCQVEMKALDELIGTKLPRLHQHLVALEAEVSVIATDWYLCLFATSLPSETVARVWDALFNEGPKVLFRVALALLQVHEEQLLAKDNAGELLIAARAAAAHMHDRDRLMDVAFEGIGSLSMAVIERHREEQTREVQAAMREHEAMKRRQDLGESINDARRRQEEEEAAAQQMEGLKVNEQLTALGKQAEVLGKQAASNMKKGFGQLMSGMKELGAKAQAGIKAHGAGGRGSGGGHDSSSEQVPAGRPPSYGS